MPMQGLFGVRAVLASFCTLLTLAACEKPETDATASNSATAVEPHEATAVDPSLYAPYKPGQDKELDHAWGPAGRDRINNLLRDAAILTSKNPGCGKVGYVSLASDRSTPPDHPVVAIDCDPVARFYVSEADVKAGAATSEGQRSANLAPHSLLEDCEAAIRAKLTEPSSFNVHVLSVATRQGVGTGYWVVDFDFDAQNGMGARLTRKGECIETPDRKMTADVSSE